MMVVPGCCQSLCRQRTLYTHIRLIQIYHLHAIHNGNDRLLFVSTLLLAIQFCDKLLEEGELCNGCKCLYLSCILVLYIAAIMCVWLYVITHGHFRMFCACGWLHILFFCTVLTISFWLSVCKPLQHSRC